VNGFTSLRIIFVSYSEEDIINAVSHTDTISATTRNYMTPFMSTSKKKVIIVLSFKYILKWKF